MSAKKIASSGHAPGERSVVRLKVPARSDAQRNLEVKLAAMRGRVVAALLSKGVPRDEVEDVTQVALFKAARNAARIEGADNGGLEAYATKIGEHAWFRRAKRLRRDDRRLQHWRASQRTSVPAPDDGFLQARETLGAYVEFIAKLSTGVRAAAMACHVQGLSRRDAAKALHIPMGTLDSRLNLVLKTFRRAFEASGQRKRKP